MSLGVQILSNGVAIADLSYAVRSVRVAWGEHGPADLSVDLQLPLWLSWQIYGWTGALDVQLTWHGRVIWRGRLERSALIPQGISITAAGYWRALTDVPYTALWSSTSVGDFRPVLIQEIANAYPDRYEMDTNNRVFITPRKGETLGNTPYIAYQAYEAPDQGVRDIVALSFDYELLAPVNWRVGCNVYTNAALPWTLVAGPWSLNATGVLQTGSQSVTFSASDVVTFWMYYNAAPAVYGGETGAAYLRITNLRIKTTTVATVLSSAIASALVTYINGINSAQLRSDTTGITATTLDLRDEIYEDAYPSDILVKLALLEGYQVGVDESQTLFFEPVGTSSRAWAIDLSQPEIERALSDLRNRRYATYQDASGRTLRTAVADNTLSQARNGIIRSAPVDANTTSSSQATTIRDTALADSADPVPRYQVQTGALWTMNSAPADLVEVRAGDTITIRNIPASLGATAEEIRTFRVARAEVSFSQGRKPVLTIEPTTPVPRLDVLLAKIEER
jgi:hypothetical protein